MQNYIKPVSETTIAVMNYMRDCHKLHVMATYKRMGKIISELEQIEIDKVYPGKRYFIQSAVAYLKRDDLIMFECIPRQGYQPIIADDHKVKRTDKVRLAKINSQVKKANQELKTVNVSKLTAEGKESHVVLKTKLAIHELVANEKSLLLCQSISKEKIKVGVYTTSEDDVKKVLSAIAS